MMSICAIFAIIILFGQYARADPSTGNLHKVRQMHPLTYPMQYSCINSESSGQGIFFNSGLLLAQKPPS